MNANASVSRQTEINEWQYNSKLEMLFISQLAFMGLSFIIALYAIAYTGVFGFGIVHYSAIIISIILLAVIVSRYLYNRDSRDKRYWNRKVFSGDYSKPSTVSPSANAALTANRKMCRRVYS